MLSEIAITPAVLETWLDSKVEVQEVCLRMLKDFILDAAVVRNLYNGQWSKDLLAAHGGLTYQQASKLLIVLANAQRLRTVPACSGPPPSTDLDWCREALKSARTTPDLLGIVTVESTANEARKQGMAEDTLLGRVNDLSSSPWWPKAQPSSVLKRDMREYKRALATTLRCSTHVEFIDQYIDPAKPGYRNLLDLLLMVNDSAIVEVHRSIFDPRDGKRDLKEWRSRFADWDYELKARRRKLRVYFWPDMHDRFLITNLVGISLPHGLDVTRDINKPPTVWSRLSRDAKDSIEKQFAAEKASAHLSLGFNAV